MLGVDIATSTAAFIVLVVMTAILVIANLRSMSRYKRSRYWGQWSSGASPVDVGVTL
jgi:hypothetical protein